MNKLFDYKIESLLTVSKIVGSSLVGVVAAYCSNKIKIKTEIKIKKNEFSGRSIDITLPCTLVVTLLASLFDNAFKTTFRYIKEKDNGLTMAGFFVAGFGLTSVYFTANSRSKETDKTAIK